MSVGGSRVPRMQHTDASEEEQVALVALLGEQAGTDSTARASPTPRWWAPGTG
jgi:hypothetical protein